MKHIIKLVFTSVLIANMSAMAATWTVTSTANGTSGDGVSLRWAIEEANNNAGADVIDFSIAGAGPHVINITSLLPALTDNAGVTIDGFANSMGTANTNVIFTAGINSTYKIVIKSGVSGANILLDIASNNNIIKGIVFEDCASAGTLINISGDVNKIEGCFIGMQSNGTSKGANNATYGIKINSGADGNIVGGGLAAKANLISGMSNYGYGIYISGTNTKDNEIKNNIIGLQKNGTTLVSSTFQLYGVYITGTAYNNTVGGIGSIDGNVISGQYGQYSSGTKYYGVGVYINSTHSSGNKIYGNRIGTQRDGSTVVSSNKQYFGIRIVNSPNNLIGDNSTYGGNVISGNGPIPSLGTSQIWATGLLIEGSSSSGNIVKHNYIGCNAAGTGYVVSAEQYKGIRIKSAGTGNKIGGTATGDGNVISGNTCNFGGSCGEGRGITIKNTSSVTIQGNIIGLNASGTGMLSNAPNEKQYWGIEIDSTSTNNTIGGSVTGERNIISGNGNNTYGGIGVGIMISASNCTGNVIKGNYIGLQIDGLTPVSGNVQGFGININSGASNTIGGTAEGDRNVISCNLNSGILISSSGNSNSIIGNYLGPDKNGGHISGNTQAYGVYITSGSSNNIGGSSAGQGNLISANVTAGILLNGSGVTNNNIKRNYIGTNKTANGLISGANQGIGIWTVNSASNNTIGGTTSGDGNVISCNSVGIQFNSNSNFVYNNRIGSDGATTPGPISGSNQSYGIYIDAANNTIGGSSSNQPNTIAFNTANGVYILGSSATGNKVSRNPIYSNTGKGIELNYGAGASAGNAGKVMPDITSVTSSLISGTATSGDVIEVFKNTTGNCFDAVTYVGTTTANGSNQWSFAITLTAGEHFLATATASNNTSEFRGPSNGVLVSANPNPICEGQTTQLSITNYYGGTIQWQSSPNNTTYTNISGATNSPYNTAALTASTYFRATITSSGCGPINSSFVLVTVNPNPTVTITTAIPAFAPVTLNATGATSYSWSPTSGLNLPLTPSPLATPTITTTYTVTGTTSGCTGTATITVNVNGIYCKVSRQLDGGFCRIVGSKLFFKYDEEYNDSDGNLVFKIYNDKQEIIATDVSTVSPTPVVYGDNRYLIDMSTLTYISPHSFSYAKYYILEVENEKNEKWYLRFLTIDPLSQ